MILIDVMKRLVMMDILRNMYIRVIKQIMILVILFLREGFFGYQIGRMIFFLQFDDFEQDLLFCFVLGIFFELLVFVRRLFKKSIKVISLKWRKVEVRGCNFNYVMYEIQFSVFIVVLMVFLIGQRFRKDQRGRKRYEENGDSKWQVFININ